MAAELFATREHVRAAYELLAREGIAGAAEAVRAGNFNSEASHPKKGAN